MEKIQKALISVSNKDNLRSVIDSLKKYKIEIMIQVEPTKK